MALLPGGGSVCFTVSPGLHSRVSTQERGLQLLLPWSSLILLHTQTSAIFPTCRSATSCLPTYFPSSASSTCPGLSLAILAVSSFASYATLPRGTPVGIQNQTFQLGIQGGLRRGSGHRVVGATEEMDFTPGHPSPSQQRLDN